MLSAIDRIRVAEISRESRLSGKVSYRLEADFFAFSGHFPGRPILPAILQIKLGLRLCEILTGEKLTVNSIERAKFMLPIAPASDVLVQARLQATGDDKPGFRATVNLSAHRRKAASFTLNLSLR